jgi:hypothetical protein
MALATTETQRFFADRAGGLAFFQKSDRFTSLPSSPASGKPPAIA